ncbi:MAG: uroporphyrinogen III methyltransferase/synthase, partial [Glaciecola sp.]
RGPGEHVALVRWGTTPRQRVLRATLATVADQVERTGFRSPAVTVVGPVAAMGDGLAWREELPLFGRSVLVPRSRNQASALAMRIRALGGEPVEAPTIDIRPAEAGPLDSAARHVDAGDFAAIAFTSPNGVDALADAFERIGADARALAGLAVIGCVGPGTAARLWERLRVRPDLVPDVSTTSALGAAWPEGSGRVLLARADLATDELPLALRAAGWEPIRIDAYITARPDDFPAGVAARLAEGSIDLIALASSSTARNFVELLEGRPWQGRVVSIGPVTSATCEDLGVPVHHEADPHDLDGLLDALVSSAQGLGSLR